MSELHTEIPTDTWVESSWKEYIKTIENPTYAKAKVELALSF